MFKVWFWARHVQYQSCSLFRQNHLSGGGTCQVDDRTYQLEMSLFFGDDIETMTNESFSPQGTV